MHLGHLFLNTASIIYTIFIFFGMFSFAGAALLFIQFKDQRQRYVSSWIIGSILIGTATVLVSLKDIAPDIVSYKLGNGLNIAAYIYFYYSCISLLGKKILFNWVAIKAFAASIIFMVALILVGDNFGVKYQPALVALCGLVFNSCTGLLVIKFYKQRHIRLAFALATLFFLTALVWGIRCFMIIFGDLGFAFEGGAVNFVSFLLLLVLGIARYMSFAGLVTSIEWRKREELIFQVHAMKVELANKKVEQSELQLLTSLNALAKARDNETGNHIIRTQNYVKELALRLRNDGHYTESLSDKSIDLLFKATPLHDIGKVGIPDNILLKNGPLTDEEWAIMKSHTLIGENVLDAVEVERDGEADLVSVAIKIAGGHHEKWDGTGYPRGLKGNEIPLSARIMALADVYDALVSERVYKSGWDHEDAVKEIVSKSGTHFDPLVVDALIAEQSNFQDIAQKYRDN
jgi:response regulator RpfG family c-di-GMP phosphodiesterase